MTHLAVLALFVVLTLRDLAHHDAAIPVIHGLSAQAIILGALLPFAAIAVAVHLAMRSLGRTLDRTGSPAAVAVAGRILDASRLLTIAAHAWAVLGLGWLDLVRATFGDLPGVDELLAMAPALATITLGWASYHAIDQRIREAGLLGALDRGDDIPRLIPRSTYIVEQFRHNILFILIPVTLMVIWWESLATLAALAADRWPWAARAYEAGWPLTIIHLAGVLALIALMPLALRRVWRTDRIGPGPLRDRLVALGAAHGVRFRDVLVWRTHTRLANAAVIGVAPIARFVMLSETLLERLPLIGVEAVMAHEVGHARRHHIPWLMAAMVATITLVFDAADRLSAALAPTDHTASLHSTGIATILAIAACIAALGYISRRFELQADAFAAQHLSGYRTHRPPHTTTAAPPISPESADTMIRALGAVAALNHSDPRRFTLRHGSIRWRQSHLHHLVGTPADRLPIDRTVRAIKIAIILAIAAVIALALTGA